MLGLFRSSIVRSALRTGIPRALPSAVHARTFLTTPAFSAPTTIKRTTTTAKKPVKKAPTKKVAAKPKAKKTVKAKAVKKAVEKKPKRPTLNIPKEQLPPKRPGTAFSLYLASKYIVEPYTNTNRAEFAQWIKKQSTAWKDMSDAEKVPFLSRAAAAREAHEKEVQKWIDTTPPTVVRHFRSYYRKKGKISPVPLEVKRSDGFQRPPNAYVMFCKEQRAKQAPVDSRETATSQLTQLAAQWRAMSVSDKDVYRKQYATALADYNVRKAEVETATI